jgi:hypothetical protein
LNTLGIIVDGVGDVSSMITAANATASVASNSAQMPLSNQDAGARAIQMMGEKAKSFTGEDSNAVVDLTAAMLGAGSNMFDAAYSNVAKVVENKTDIALLVKIRIHFSREIFRS